jgi:Ca-activated chloride channel family protein
MISTTYQDAGRSARVIGDGALRIAATTSAAAATAQVLDVACATRASQLELLTVSFRYKRPEESESRLLAVVVKDRNTHFANASENFRFSAAVAEFGMLLRGSSQSGSATMAQVIRTAQSARGEDEHGYRAEFVNLAETARELMGSVENAQR